MNKIAHLYRQWLARELKLRFASSVLGPLWLVLMPVVQIAVFTLLFFQIFGMRWPHGEHTWVNYGLNIFIGLAVFSFIGDTLNRSASIVPAYPYLVTKVRFPLLLLPLLPLGVALIQLSISIVVVALWNYSNATLIGCIGSVGVLFVLSLYGAAGAWFVAALGTYFRDVAVAVPTLVSLLMFLSPVFYPSSAVPASLKPLVTLNPIAWAADGLRGLWVLGQPLSLEPALTHALVAGLLCYLAGVFYCRLAKGFSDVL